MFDSYKKELEKLGYKVYTKSVTNARGDIVASINPYGELDTKDPAIISTLAKPVEVEKVRSRTKEGHFIADDPTTPEVNEAWVEKVKKKVAKKK